MSPRVADNGLALGEEADFEAPLFVNAQLCLVLKWVYTKLSKNDKEINIEKVRHFNREEKHEIIQEMIVNGLIVLVIYLIITASTC